MKVSELIKELRKCDPDAVVLLSAHDQMFSGWASNVNPYADPEDADEAAEHIRDVIALERASGLITIGC